MNDIKRQTVVFFLSILLMINYSESLSESTKIQRSKRAFFSNWFARWRKPPAETEPEEIMVHRKVKYSNSRTDSYGPPSSHGHDDEYGFEVSPLAAIIAPLAGVALLGVAAAFAANPLLITLAVLNNGGRRKREIEDDILPDNPDSPEEILREIQVLDNFVSKAPVEASQPTKVLATYLHCSKFSNLANRCLDRVTCEWSSDSSMLKEAEKDVISIILHNIMSNEYVDTTLKQRLKTAAKIGKDFNGCMLYSCAEMGKTTTS